MSLAEQMAGLGIEEHPFHVGEGLSKLFKMPAGTVIGQHAHPVGHDSVLLVGEAILRRDGVELELTAPQIVHLPAGVEHSVEAVTPVLWACNWPRGLE